METNDEVTYPDETQGTDESNDFSVSFASRRETRRGSVESVIEDEVHRFLSDNRAEYFNLNEYPNIRHVFYRHNTTLCSSAAVERVFSQSNMIFTPRRNRLLSDNFEHILLLKHNRKNLVL